VARDDWGEGKTSEIRVLVVDEHDLFRSGLSSLLAEEPDIEVVAQVSSSRAGVRLAHELRPDVVLMGLPITDQPAPEATREIMSDRPSTCVLVMAADPCDEDIEEALRAGARGFVAKETPIRMVVTAVKSAAAGTAWLSPHVAELVLGRTRKPDPQKEANSESVEGLSDRELDVLRLLARGLDNEAIAARLDISPRAVRNHIASILRRLDPPGPGPEGLGGVREPRRPRPETGGGSARVQPPPH
jgi:DNA-binding NarL/FixJ family response regulator